MGEITALLESARGGDASALHGVFEVVYPRLRKLAASRLASQHATLSPTELVHDAFVRLAGSEPLALEDRRHFFACAARAMRLLLVDRARRVATAKRGGEALRVTWTEAVPAPLDDAETLLDLDEALKDLKSVNPRAHDVVNLRFFAGLTAPETAETLGISLRTANREWKKSRAFLHARIKSVPDSAASQAP